MSKPHAGSAPSDFEDKCKLRPSSTETQGPDTLLSNEALNVHRCSKTYFVRGKDVPTVEDISLTIHPGEVFCIVGGSGCGKSTLLKMIAGLESPTSGTISVGNRLITSPGLDRGLVFQEHRLLPWLDVWQNIDFGLRESVKQDRSKIINEHIELVGLKGFEHAYPGQLSGGMAQRAGLARALVNRPLILLLDEPLGALDALIRQQMQQEILRIWDHEKTTMVLVTHDLDEAISMGDRVAVIGGRPGRIRQIYNVDLPRPRRRASAAFESLRSELWNCIFQQ